MQVVRERKLRSHLPQLLERTESLVISNKQGFDLRQGGKSNQSRHHSIPSHDAKHLLQDLKVVLNGDLNQFLLLHQFRERNSVFNFRQRSVSLEDDSI